MMIPYNVADVRFQLGQNIGHEGRNSDVFLATDIHLNAEIVMKRMSKIKLNANNFFDEAQVLYRSSHPNIIPIHYACQDNDYIYLAMPYYNKGSLKQIAKNESLTVKQIVRYTLHFLSGLHNIHSKGLVHLDIKPDNILISDRDEAVLSDFGLAKNLNIHGQAALTRHYVSHLAPEVFGQAQDQAPIIDRLYDIYQVGVTLYRLLIGEDVFKEQLITIWQNGGKVALMSAIETGVFPNRNALPVHIPNKMKTIVKKCLEVDPVARYQSVLELSNALAAIPNEGTQWKVDSEQDHTLYTFEKDGGSSVVLNLLENGSCTAYNVNAAGNRSRIRDMCKDAVSKRELYAFLMSK
ncbi:serine/threonine-protein kinase [Citrobacter braakii]|uniref:serine/threonine-protein kinase n=1 Tax=Citrobacter braakii TaxID=57706 RepID=UPI0012995BB3|nr:serine/threonine-protein kinase [Citrobacter braakii]MEB8063595.1 serine/threonine protein kinase [Citrobacter braakii]MRE78205.1 protein kinase [Citrobacter braakii]